MGFISALEATQEPAHGKGEAWEALAFLGKGRGEGEGEGDGDGDGDGAQL